MGEATPRAAWIADRALGIEMSGVRRIFELGRSLKDPVNLSIGQPHSVRATVHPALTVLSGRAGLQPNDEI